MTRKDFKTLAESIARILNRIQETTDREDIKKIILEEIISFCNGQNSLFDSRRFINAVNELENGD